MVRIDAVVWTSLNVVKVAKWFASWIPVDLLNLMVCCSKYLVGVVFPRSGQWHVTLSASISLSISREDNSQLWSCRKQHHNGHCKRNEGYSNRNQIMSFLHRPTFWRLQANTDIIASNVRTWHFRCEVRRLWQIQQLALVCISKTDVYTIGLTTSSNVRQTGWSARKR